MRASLQHGYYMYHMLLLLAGIAQSVQRLAKGWTVQGSNVGGGEIIRTCPEGLGGPPSLLYNGYRFVPGGKGAGAFSQPHTPTNSEVKERVQLYLYSPTCLHGILLDKRCFILLFARFYDYLPFLHSPFTLSTVDLLLSGGGGGRK